MSDIVKRRSNSQVARGDEPRATHILKARLTARLAVRSRSKLVFLSVPKPFELPFASFAVHREMAAAANERVFERSPAEVNGH